VALQETAFFNGLLERPGVSRGAAEAGGQPKRLEVPEFPFASPPEQRHGEDEHAGNQDRIAVNPWRQV